MLLTFGSFGDIVTACDIASRIYRTLRASKGASLAYQQLITELHALTLALRIVGQADANAAVRAESMRTRVTLDRLWVRVRSARSKLGHDSWRKIGWGVFAASELAECAEQLAAHRAALATVLLASIMGSVASLTDEVRQGQAELTERADTILAELRTSRGPSPRDILPDLAIEGPLSSPSSTSAPSLYFTWEWLLLTDGDAQQFDSGQSQTYKGTGEVDTMKDVFVDDLW
ncbi:hypothetical protein BC834DRAFT_843027 [Gloeopeniophorella convolvens]|nr:hypothetical protein BC834DRAFT_843027 [Gloeopeniophorella convolvens]